MGTSSLDNFFESLVFEADTQRFLKNVPSDRMTSGSGKENLSKIGGSGEVRDTEGRARRDIGGDLMAHLGLDPEDRHTNWIERDFIVAKVVDSLSDRQNNIRGEERLTYPTLDIYGAITVNPVTKHAGTTQRKFKVVDTTGGLPMTEKPVFYAIRVGEKPWLSGNATQGVAKQEQQQFASENYSNPKDETTAFNDYRMYSKSEDDRKKRETDRKGVRDASSVGYDLIRQNNNFGIITDERNNYNTTMRNVFQATRHLTVDDVHRFVTRKCASNALAMKFLFLTKDGKNHSIFELLGKYGDALANGTLSGKILAEQNWSIFRSRIEVNPGVDNEHFFEGEAGNGSYVQSPYGGNDWRQFLSDIASTANGFGTADSIFAGLDDRTLFGLYAKYCIPVRLNRIYFAKKAIGDMIVAGHTMAFNNVQNKNSTLQAKEFFEIVKNVPAPGAYRMPDGRDMLVASVEKSVVKFPDYIVSGGGLKKIGGKPLSMNVSVVSGLIIRYAGTSMHGVPLRGIHEMFFRVPVCKVPGKPEFIFMRYGRGDMGPADGIGDCTTPETMGQGIMMTLHEPLADISFMSKDADAMYKSLLAGQLDVDDKTFTHVNTPSDPEMLDISSDEYRDMFGRNPDDDELEEYNRTVRGKSASNAERAANKFAEQDDDEYDPILNDPEEYKRFIDSLPDSELRPTSGGDGSLVFRPMDGTDDFDDSFDEDPYRNDQAD